MDFHSLSRKDLQTLCKKNKIPANITNVAMADALQSLQFVEGIEDLQQQPSVPLTPRTSSTRTRSVKDPAAADLESSVPVTRARRGTAAKALTARIRVCKEDDQEKEESSDSQQILLESNGSELPPKTPRGKRATGASVRRKIEAEIQEEKYEKENEIPVPTTGLRAYSIRRSSRLSEKKLQEAVLPPSIQKSRGRKQVIKIAELSEECEDSEIKLKEDSQKSDDAKEEEQETNSDLVPPKPDYLPKITGGIVEEKKCDSDPMADGDLLLNIKECASEDCSSDPVADGDLPNIKDCGTEDCGSDAHQNPASGDVSAAGIWIDNLQSSLPSEYYHDQVSDYLKPEDSSTLEKNALVECEESVFSDTEDVLYHDEKELMKPSYHVQAADCEETRIAADVIDSVLEEVKSSKQVMLGCEEGGLKSSNSKLVPSECEDSMIDDDLEEQKSFNEVLPEFEVSIADPNVNNPAENVNSECETTDPEEDDRLIGGEVLAIESLKESKSSGQDMTEIDVDQDGESGGSAIADSSFSVECLMNPEKEDCEGLVPDGELKVEFAQISSSMKNLTLGHQEDEDSSAQNTANPSEFCGETLMISVDDVDVFGGSKTSLIETTPVKNNTAGPGFINEIPAGNQSLIGSLGSSRIKIVPDFLNEILAAGNQSLLASPASLRRRKVSAPNPGTPLGSRSCSVSELGLKKGGTAVTPLGSRSCGVSELGLKKWGATVMTPIRSNIFEDDDKENKGRESVKMETKVMIVNGEDKEQKNYNDMSLGKLKKMLKEKTKDELAKRHVLLAVNENC